MRGDLVNIGKKVDAHAISINHLKLQMAQLSSTINPRELGTLSSNTVKNPKYDGNCMPVTTRGCKPTMDPLMTSSVEHEKKLDDEVMEVKGDLVYKLGKED